MLSPDAKKNKFLIFALIFFLSLLAAQDIIPLKEIKPGMTGYGLSVFRGNRIERFQVEVIDILEGFLPGESIILVRCAPAHGGFDLNRSGVIAGMSGSPIYFDNRLAGALALGWSFSKDPIAGITPIETMLKIAERPMETKLSRAPKKKNYPAIGGLTPLQTPLFIHGVTPEAFDLFRKEFKRYGWFSVHGGNGRGKVKEDYKIVPGSAIGGQLMAGDLDITAIGTVTWVKNDQVLAFGHSFFNAGEFMIPITTAHIATIMQSDLISFKLGSSVEQVGSLLQDRLTGIYGKLGKVSPMLPISVKISNKTHKTSRTFHARAIKNPFLTSRLCSIAVFNFLSMQEATLGQNTVWIRTKVYINGEQPIEWSNIYAGKLFLNGNFTGPISYLEDNPFQVFELQKVEVEIDVLHKMHSAVISSLNIDSCEVTPGETVMLNIGLTPYQKSEEFVTMPFKIPEDRAAGVANISIMGGGRAKPIIAEPEDGKQYIEALRKVDQYKNNQIVAQFGISEFKIYCRGKEMKDLPGTVISNLLPANRTKDIQIVPEIYSKTIDTPYVISGTANITIDIKEKEKQ